ncbi:nuclear transport factor 2 family protein [Dyella humicola]|uniref:nuclear transport factor 2 family protein n=1 Tax=Dyella humicola TaxID=2992126 RepID=UPI0022549DB4|nr:nuclear transport factor 2 family protein [Dyella humicola]
MDVFVRSGDNAISGAAVGASAVVERARLIASDGLNFELRHILVSRNNMALSLDNTAVRDELKLDEHLLAVSFLRDGKTSAIETYLSDLSGMNAFFPAPSSLPRYCAASCSNAAAAPMFFSMEGGN